MPARSDAPALSGLWRPFVQTAMYVLPVTLGAGLVADHVIEKQSEIRTTEPYFINQSEPRISELQMQANSALLAENELRAELINLHQQLINSVGGKASATGAPGAVGATGPTPSLPVNLETKLDNIYTFVSAKVPQKTSVTLGLEPGLLEGVAKSIPKLADVKFNFPADGFTVFLGNARPQPSQAVSALASSTTGTPPSDRSTEDKMQDYN